MALAMIVFLSFIAFGKRKRKKKEKKIYIYQKKILFYHSGGAMKW